jgi:hypothetical protein
MVVPVLITSCQDSEKSKSGPVMSQAAIISNEVMNAAVVPVK